MALSRVRLDPPAGIYNFRGYDELGDSDLPLDEDQRKYKIIGTVTIAGTCARTTATLGDMKDHKLRKDFDRELMSRGVKTLHWERHEHGRTDYYTRELR